MFSKLRVRNIDIFKREIVFFFPKKVLNCVFLSSSYLHKVFRVKF